MIEAVGVGKPVLFVVREPVDSIVSWHQFTGQAFERIIAHYVVFHRKLSGYRSQMVVATFDKLMTDFSKPLQRLQLKYGIEANLDFSQDTLAQQTLAAIDRDIEASGKVKDENIVPRPSPQRAVRKAGLLAELRAPRFEPALVEAEAVYRDFAGE